MNNNRINILSGGLGTDLCINGGFEGPKVDNDPLWSARIFYENPKAVKEVHLRFLKAGSNVITTATYQASVKGFMEHANLSKKEAEDVIKSTVDIAREAVKEFGGSENIIVGGSMGPYGAMLHDLSEYKGSYIDTVPSEVIREYHRIQMELLLSKNVDFLAFETIPAAKEAFIFAELLQEFPNAKAWITFTTKDGAHTSHGDCLRDTFRELASHEQVIAVGVNCSKPQLVLGVVKLAKEHLTRHQRVVVYPNSKWQDYTTVSPKPLPWLNLIPTWLETGVIGWLGGCCMVTPDDITQIKETVRDWEDKTAKISS